MEGAGEELPYGGLPGRIVAPNLTPDTATGAGNWSDDQLARAIREGIGHDGRALFPIMPFQHYRAMSDEDLASVIVYLRSLPAARHELPKMEIIFPVKYLIRSVPEPVTSPVANENTSDPVNVEPRLPTSPVALTATLRKSRGRAFPASTLQVARYSRVRGRQLPAQT